MKKINKCINQKNHKKHKPIYSSLPPLSFTKIVCKFEKNSRGIFGLLQIKRILLVTKYLKKIYYYFKGEGDTLKNTILCFFLFFKIT